MKSSKNDEVIGKRGQYIDTLNSKKREEFELLVYGCFSKADISVSYRPEGSLWDPPASTLIDRIWSTYLHDSSEAGIMVYNGALFRLDNLRQENGHLWIELSDTDFRQCIGTANTEFESAFPAIPQVNPLAASVALVTSDNKIIIEKRNRIDARRRAYHVIAGYMERNWDGTQPHPFDTLIREVREELGVELDGTDLKATGLIRANYGSEVCFCCHLPNSFDEILRIQTGLGKDSEIEMLEAINDNPQAVAAFLTAHITDMAPPGRACLLLYGRKTYGDDWYHGVHCFEEGPSHSGKGP
jgi:hypothetical protein